MATRKITISDVARRAGVSTGTVSAVLNKRPTVREQTRLRVLEAIDDLGYRPSLSARHLGGLQRSGRAFDPMVGIIIKEMDNPFFAEVAIGAQEALTRHGYLSMVCSSEGNYEKEELIIRVLRNRFLNGLIVSPALHAEADLSHLFQLRQSGFPFILLEGVMGLQTHMVSVDNVQASQRAVSYLIERGHEQIVHFAGPDYSQHSRDRVLGVEKAFSQSHLRFSADVVVPAGAHVKDGYEAALRLFRQAPPPTAVTCFNDLVALGVMRALTERGLRIPEDVSLVGFDDIPPAAYAYVPLTTMRVPKREMGRLAAERLLALLDGEEPSPPVHTVLQAEIVERESTQARG